MLINALLPPGRHPPTQVPTDSPGLEPANTTIEQIMNQRRYEPDLSSIKCTFRFSSQLLSVDSYGTTKDMYRGRYDSFVRETGYKTARARGVRRTVQYIETTGWILPQLGILLDQLAAPGEFCLAQRQITL